MLAEGVLEYAVVSGLVMEHSSQGSSFSGSCLVSQIDLCCKLLNVECNVQMFIFCEAALQQCIMKSAIQINVNLIANNYLFIVALYTFIANY